MINSEDKRSTVIFDVCGGKSVSWLRRVLERLGFSHLAPQESIPADAVITRASLHFYVDEEDDDGINE